MFSNVAAPKPEESKKVGSDLFGAKNQTFVDVKTQSSSLFSGFAA
jgi:hypothetical protein